MHARTPQRHKGLTAIGTTENAGSDENLDNSEGYGARNNGVAHFAKLRMLVVDGSSQFGKMCYGFISAVSV